MNRAISNVTYNFSRKRFKLRKAIRTGRVEDLERQLIHFMGDVKTLRWAVKEACKFGQLYVVMWLVEKTVLRDKFYILRESLFLSIDYTQWDVAKWLERLLQFDVDYTDSTRNKVKSIDKYNFNKLDRKLKQAVHRGLVKEVISLPITLPTSVYEFEEACENGKLGVMMWLVKHSELRNDMRVCRRTLILAHEVSYLTDVMWLTEHTVLRDDMTSCSKALTLACTIRRFTEMRWLLEHTVLQYNGAELSRALHFAARKNNIKQSTLLKGLLQTMQATDFNVTDHMNRNNTMLHYVIGHSMNETSRDTALHNVYSMMEAKMCKLIYVYDKDVNAQNAHGDTPLHKACSHGSSDIVGALLLAGADETITNDDGETPVRLVEPSHRSSTVKLLSLLDVSSKWKLLVRSQRLRRRTAVRMIMTLVKWKVEQTRKWSILMISSFQKLLISQPVTINSRMSLKQIWDVTTARQQLWTYEYLGRKRDQAAVKKWLTVMFIKILCTRLWISPAVYEAITSWSLLDVSSKWKLLVRSHRLNRQTDVRVMMTVVTWSMRYISSM